MIRTIDLLVSHQEVIALIKRCNAPSNSRTLDIQPPDLETKIAILRRAAGLR